MAPELRHWVLCVCFLFRRLRKIVSAGQLRKKLSQLSQLSQTHKHLERRGF